MGVFLRHLFLPHHTNNHRAKVLHVDALSLYVLAFLFYQILTWIGNQTIPQILGYATDIRLEQLLSLTNAKRQEAGLSPLSLNEKLSQAAAGKAADMFAKGYWAHTSPDGKLPWDFIVGAGYRYTVAGENLAKNFNDSKGVVDAWMASDTHKDNLLKPSYKDIGFAIVNGTLGGEETTLVVQLFGATSQPIAIIPRQEEIVRKVEAQGSAPPPVVTEEAIAVQRIAGESGELPLAHQFREVVKHPLFNLSSMNRSLTFLFIGLLMTILAVDIWIVRRRRIVRVSGRSHAHLLFFATLLILVGLSLPGSVL